MKKEQLIITYTFQPALKPDQWKTLADKLDKKLENAAKSFGFKFVGSGFDFKTKVRDISFYKIKK